MRGTAAAVGPGVAVLLLSGCAATAPAPAGAPLDDPGAPRLATPTSSTSEAADGEGCARMGQGRSAHASGPVLAREATDDLHLVFAAATDVSTAVAYREDDGDRIFFCTGFSLREDFSGASSSVIPVPTGSAAATFAGGGGGYAPGENVVDFFGYASPDVAHVVVTTPDGLEHLAALDGGVWWAAPVVDESVASRAGEGTWRALDRDGDVVADGSTDPG